MTLGRFSSY